MKATTGSEEDGEASAETDRDRRSGTEIETGIPKETKGKRVAKGTVGETRKAGTEGDISPVQPTPLTAQVPIGRAGPSRTRKTRKNKRR